MFIEFRIDTNDEILDAACGTGAVRNELFEKGFEKLSMTDGLNDMINYAKKNINQNIPIDQCDWKCLDLYFNKVGKFDPIIIFGNSLAHAKQKSHNQIFKNIYSGLKNGGHFLFDIREWTNDNDENRIQPNKPNNSFAYLGQISISGKDFTVDSEIRYNQKEQKQIVSYLIKDLKTTKVVESIFLEYSIFTIDDILPSLQLAGFLEENIQVRNIDDWSYKIICCKK